MTTLRPFHYSEDSVSRNEIGEIRVRIAVDAASLIARERQIARQERVVLDEGLRKVLEVPESAALDRL